MKAARKRLAASDIDQSVRFSSVAFHHYNALEQARGESAGPRLWPHPAKPALCARSVESCAAETSSAVAAPREGLPGADHQIAVHVRRDEQHSVDAVEDAAVSRQ